MSKRILFVVNTNTYFRGLFNIARKLQERSFEAHIVFDAPYPTIEQDLKLCATAKISYSTRDEFRFSKNAFIRIFQSVLQRGKLGNFFKPLIQTLHDLRSIGKLLKDYKPSLLALAADHIAYSTGIYIKLAHRLGVKSVIFPQWLANEKEPAEFIYHDPSYEIKSLWSRFIGKFFPEWVLNYKGKKLLRLPPSKIIIKKLLQISPPHPWILHSGRADCIALESKAMNMIAQNLGLPKHQTIVTGSLEHDILYTTQNSQSEFQKKLYKKYGFSESKPLIVTALPPNFLTYTGGRPQCEFKTYEELVRKWIDALDIDEKANILICVHPSVEKNLFTHEEKLNIRVCDEQLVNVLALADLFVASVSATIQWAICSNIPVINYDVYQYDYDEYKDVPGVTLINDFNSFHQTIDQLIHNPLEIHSLKNEQKKVSSLWGALDGQASDRIVQLVHSLDNV